MSRITTSTMIHCASTVEANSDNGVPGSLKLEFRTEEWRDGYAEYVAFLGDQVLADRLAKAINEIVSARKAELLCCIDVDAA